MGVFVQRTPPKTSPQSERERSRVMPPGSPLRDLLSALLGGRVRYLFGALPEPFRLVGGASQSCIETAPEQSSSSHGGLLGHSYAFAKGVSEPSWSLSWDFLGAAFGAL